MKCVKDVVSHHHIVFIHCVCSLQLKYELNYVFYTVFFNDSPRKYIQGKTSCFLHIFYTSGVKYCLSNISIHYNAKSYALFLWQSKRSDGGTSVESVLIICLISHSVPKTFARGSRQMQNTWLDIKLTIAPNYIDCYSFIGVFKHNKIHYCLNNNS